MGGTGAIVMWRSCFGFAVSHGAQAGVPVPLEPFVSSEPDYFLMALTINSRTTAPTVAITNWPINP
jgi:hypothetical protein